MYSLCGMYLEEGSVMAEYVINEINKNKKSSRFIYGGWVGVDKFESFYSGYPLF